MVVQRWFADTYRLGYLEQRHAVQTALAKKRLRGVENRLSSRLAPIVWFLTALPDLSAPYP